MLQTQLTREQSANGHDFHQGINVQCQRHYRRETGKDVHGPQRDLCPRIDAWAESEQQSVVRHHVDDPGQREQASDDPGRHPAHGPDDHHDLGPVCAVRLQCVRQPGVVRDFRVVDHEGEDCGHTVQWKWK